MRNLFFSFMLITLWISSGSLWKERAKEARQIEKREVPTFQVDTSWEKLPNKWVVGGISAVYADSQDNIWAVHRPADAQPELGQVTAPPVLEFDASGNLIRGWGGPGKDYEWPGSEHDIFVDDKGYVWIGGSGTNPTAGNDQIVKFTKDGKFVLQIGHQGQTKGNGDRDDLSGPGGLAVYPKTNEVFVADGYFNRRVIVFDAGTGAFKRMWGAFGNVPTDRPGAKTLDQGSDHFVPVAPESDPQDDTDSGPAQFSNLHCIGISSEGLVYVCDKGNRRIQVFTVAGKYVTQVFISRGRMPPSTLTGMIFGKPRKEIADEAAKVPTPNALAFSPDTQQRFLYVADARRGQVLIYARKTLEYLGAVGDGPGTEPGEFFNLHGLATDLKGNIYTSESERAGSYRIQKFVFQGFSAVPEDGTASRMRSDR